MANTIYELRKYTKSKSKDIFFVFRIYRTNRTRIGIVPFWFGIHIEWKGIAIHTKISVYDRL